MMTPRIMASKTSGAKNRSSHPRPINNLAGENHEVNSSQLFDTDDMVRTAD